MSSMSGQQRSIRRLLSPMRVGAHTLRNRVIMGSMHTRLEHEERAGQATARISTAHAPEGGAALIITGGFSPNEAGRLEPGGPTLMAGDDLAPHQSVVDEVHKHGAKILMQILHSGRYAKHDNILGVSSIRSPINPRVPRPMTDEEIEATVDDFVTSAVLASQAGYDGVEIMGSEGYLINQFTAPRTNDRTDRWGGSAENRNRFPVEIVRRIRAALGPDFLVMYRISAIDLVERGSTGERKSISCALAVQAAGADIFNTGVGWHEAPVPTIAFSVPRAAFSFAVRRLRKVVSIPIVGVEPHQHARCRRKAARGWRLRFRLDGTADAGRPGFRAEGAGGASRKTSTPASPATRPASTSSFPTAPRPASSTRAPAARPSSTRRRASRSGSR